MAGACVPLVSLAHQYVTTSEVPALAASAAGNANAGRDGAVVGTGDTASVPILRHQGGDLYFRQVGSRIGIGSYAHRPLPARYEDLPGPDQVAGSG